MTREKRGSLAVPRTVAFQHAVIHAQGGSALTDSKPSPTEARSFCKTLGGPGTIFMKLVLGFLA